MDRIECIDGDKASSQRHSSGDATLAEAEYNFRFRCSVEADLG